ncbi:MAG: metal-dependent hydrolase [Planctomycetes bacterium]|nr:metal-dependent hydrolase [Planctomycetota bacterium]
MYGQTHAGLGWVIGVLAPNGDRRLRAWCFWSAILPDIDAVPIVFGYEHYHRWHHKPGHNVFLGAAVVIAALVHFWGRPLRERLVAGVLVAVCFASHLLTDLKLSGWDVCLFWPFSDLGYAFQPMWALGHPLNTWLAYTFMILPWLLVFWKPVTPLELLSPRLDRIFLNAFRKKDQSCSACPAPCNNACDTCSRPTCMRHGRINWRFRIKCPACALEK